MEVSASYAGGTRFDVTARGHQVICDQPVENGGADQGLTPPELLLASLATCAGYYAAEYLRTRGLTLAGLNVLVTAQKAPQPARLASFKIEVNTPPLDERSEAGLFRSVKSCLIHNTLLSGPRIEVLVNHAGAQSVRPAA